MDRKSLHRLYGATIPLPTLTDGMVIAIAMDDGPKGICGQAMSVTCPWQHLHFSRMSRRSEISLRLKSWGVEDRERRSSIA